VQNRLDVGLFGRSRLRLGDAPPIEEWPRPSARRLVTLLTLADGNLLGRERVADTLFGHLPPDRAARSVSRALSLARSALGVDIIAADATNLWLAGVDVHCDLLDLRDSLEAVVAAAGELPLPTVPDGMALADDPYEDWAIEVRDDLARLHRTALAARARATGDLADWDALARVDPTSEEACVAVARSAATAGDRDAAVRALERCRRALAQLDLRPSPALIEEVRHLADAAAARRPSPSRPVEAPRGRSREVARIVQCIDGETAGMRGTLLLRGPAGIGKSRLVAATTAALQAEGWLVGIGTAVPEDVRAPFAAMRTALRGLLGHDAALGSDLTDDPSGPEHVADNVDEALATLAVDAPVLLVVDDLHWADTAMQELLTRLASRTGRTWGLLLAARSDEPGHPTPTMPTATETLTLGPIGGDDARRIVHDEAPDLPDDEVAALVERADGNPFFLVELARHRLAHGAGAGLPEGVTALIAQRIDGLTVTPRRLLDLLALLGDQSSFDVVEQLMPDEPVRSALHELSTVSLVQITDDGPRLRHPLVREQVVASLDPIPLGDLHAEIARALEDTARRRDARAVPLLSAAAHHHLSAFLDGGRRATHALAAARAGFAEGHRAAHLFAHDAAADLLEAAIEAYDHVDAAARRELADDASAAWRELGHARLRNADVEGARHAYQRAVEVAGSGAQRARGWRALAWIPYRTGDFARCAAVCRQGLDALDDDPLAHAYLAIELAWVQIRGGEDDDALDLLQPAAELAEESGEWGLAARALDRLAVLHQGVGRLAEAQEVIVEAAAAAERAGSARTRGSVAIHWAAILRDVGDPEAALVHAEEAASLNDRVDDAYIRSVTHWVTAEIREALGDYEGAIAERDAEIRLLTPLGNDRHLAAARRHRDQLMKAASLVESTPRPAG
jgi:DNA-binding SARP family transcriptional activator/tetratricopeptide (TPR) repeat protein